MKECNKNNVIKECVNLLDEQQKVILFETFNGGTFDIESFNE